MRDSPQRKKTKYSSSSASSSDEGNSKKKSHKSRHAEKKHTHRKHKQDARPQTVDSSSDDEVKSKTTLERSGRNKDQNLPVKVKEEPLTEDERERKKRRHNEKSRSSDDSSWKGDARNRDESRRTNDYNARSSNNVSRRPVKEEVRSDIEPEWGKKDEKKEKKEAPKNNAKPDFGLSGKLTEDANTFNGVVIKYSEPPEARKPKRRWRLYPFKGEVSMPILHIHRQSAYLLGRDRKVADIPIDHPSCSKQHAALQYRLVPFTRSDGSTGRQIKPYVIDLESANGTYLNNQKIEPKKYYELKERDVVKFGFSSRDYVILHEHSKDSENDDDVHDD